MRNNLITILHCADCGKPLELASSGDSPARHDNSYLLMDPELPTGADMLENRISVHPCRYCMEKHTRPAKNLAAAIRALGEVAP